MQNILFQTIGLLLIILGNLFSPSITFARVTPNDIYQQTRSNFETNLSKIQDSVKRQSVVVADQALKDINQSVCTRFKVDIDKMAAIMEEEKSRQNITKTVVAYGQGNTPLDSAAYYLNYAAEALAYQKSQDYTPNISGGNLAGGINNSSRNLRNNLEVLQSKILRAKAEIRKALDYYEK